MGIHKTEKYEKKVCVINILSIDLTYPILTDKILIQKDSIVDCLVINTWFSYDWSSHNDYFIKIGEVYKQVSEEIYNKKFIPLAELRQNQIDSIIN
jgi:hypothetical protein